jgi:hypothetical protein
MDLNSFISFVITLIIILIIYNFHQENIRLLAYGILGLVIYLIVHGIISYLDSKYFNMNKIVIEVNPTNKNDIPVNTVKQIVNLMKKNDNIKQKIVQEIKEEHKSGPLDGLTPQEMSSRLQYLYYATSHPKNKISYIDFKTHTDKLLDIQKTSLASKDIRMIGETRSFYPDLTENQVNARDCMQSGYGKDSCYQHPKMFIKEGFQNMPKKSNSNNVLSSGINEDNAKMILKEDFSQPSPNNHKNPFKTLFVNAPGNPDEHQYDISKLLCRGCTSGNCCNDNCKLQNELFM